MRTTGRPTLQKLTIVAIVLLALACYDRNGHRGNEVGPAQLDTVYLRYRIPAVYLLFVPDVGPPGADGAWAGGGSFGAWDAEVRRNYTDYTTHRRIEARPILIRGARLRADGKSFDLTRGNILVVHMSPTGSLSVTQLPERRGADEPPGNVVTLIKAALPNDPRVQALPLPRIDPRPARGIER
jgi:hypothetical protein